MSFKSELCAFSLFLFFQCRTLPLLFSSQYTRNFTINISITQFFPKIIIINWQMIDGGYWLCCIQDEQQRTKKDGDTHRTDVKSLLDMRRLLKDHYQKQ